MHPPPITATPWSASTTETKWSMHGSQGLLTDFLRTQWNLNWMKGQGTGKMCSLYQGSFPYILLWLGKRKSFVILQGLGHLEVCYIKAPVLVFFVHEVLSTWKKWSNYLECMQSVHQPPICEKLKWIEPKINYYDSHMTKQMLGFLGSISSNHTEIFCTWVLRLFSMGHCYRILSIFTHIVTK